MKVVRSGEVESSIGSTFTGGVILDRVLPMQTEGGMAVSIVHFHDGARTNWHEHPSEQILIVLTGAGRVGDADEQHEIGPGDVVHLPPGTRHWHGARPGKSMTHISVTHTGSPTWYESPEE